LAVGSQPMARRSCADREMKERARRQYGYVKFFKLTGYGFIIPDDSDRLLK
jgi:hypothetical protein